ncbi:MAG: acyl carrier protein [Pyrinomonadaceae bacterium]|nr:acyl carrier protein [Pyrinomonadaceae bacterium]
MNKEEALAELQNIFDDIFLDEVTVTPELSANDVEEWDSLLHISLVVSVEERFKIKFRVGEVEATNNVGEFIDIILDRVNAAYV